MNIFDSDGSVRHDITEAVEAIFRYLENCPFKTVPPKRSADATGTKPKLGPVHLEKGHHLSEYESGSVEAAPSAESQQDE